MAQIVWPSNWVAAQLLKLQKQQPQLVNNALEQMLADNPDLQWSLVVNAYLDAEINLGKAAELLDLHELELRQRFRRLGIPLRIGPSDLAAAQAEADALEGWLSEKPAAS